MRCECPSGAYALGRLRPVVLRRPVRARRSRLPGRVRSRSRGLLVGSGSGAVGRSAAGSGPRTRWARIRRRGLRRGGADGDGEPGAADELDAFGDGLRRRTRARRPGRCCRRGRGRPTAAGTAWPPPARRGRAASSVKTASANAWARAMLPAWPGWMPSPDSQSGCAAMIAVQATRHDVRVPAQGLRERVVGRGHAVTEAVGAHDVGPHDAAVGAGDRQDARRPRLAARPRTGRSCRCSRRSPAAGRRRGRRPRGPAGPAAVRASDHGGPGDVPVGHQVGEPRVGAEREGVAEDEDVLTGRQHRCTPTGDGVDGDEAPRPTVSGCARRGRSPPRALGSPAARMARPTTSTAATPRRRR